MTVLIQAAVTAMSRLRTAIEVGPPPAPTPASRPSPVPGFRSGAGADRRSEDLGSPYGASAAFGIGLTPDCFSRPVRATRPESPVVPEALLVRFDG